MNSADWGVILTWYWLEMLIGSLLVSWLGPPWRGFPWRRTDLAAQATQVLNESELLRALDEIAANEWTGYGGPSGGLSARGRAQLALARCGVAYTQRRPQLEHSLAVERSKTRIQ